MGVQADYTAAPYDVKMTQGDTLTETFVFRDEDGDLLALGGYTFLSQIRQTAAGTAIAQFTIAVDTDTSTVVRSLGTAITSGLSGRYVHDLQWTDPSSNVRTLIAGEFEVVAEVTRA